MAPEKTQSTAKKEAMPAEQKAAASSAATRAPGLRDEVERLFDELSTRFFGSPPAEMFAFDFPRMRRLFDVVPAADLVEADGSYRVTVELPGMTEKDVEVKIVGDTLTISGEKKEEHEEKEKDRYLCERRFGKFRRSFRIPGNVDREKVSAKFKNGVLELALPKAQTTTSTDRKIPIGG